MKTGYLIDMDGVIYRENQLIPGAAEFVQALTATGTPFLFLTNNSAPTPEDLAVRLKHLGIQGLSARHFYTSAMNTADFLSETDPGCTVFVIGEGGLLTALHERKIASDAIQPRYVVVGEGAATMERLAKAHECVERGARLLATNPVTPANSRPAKRRGPRRRSENRPGLGSSQQPRLRRQNLLRRPAGPSPSDGRLRFPQAPPAPGHDTVACPASVNAVDSGKAANATLRAINHKLWQSLRINRDTLRFMEKFDRKM